MDFIDCTETDAFVCASAQMSLSHLTLIVVSPVLVCSWSHKSRCSSLRPTRLLCTRSSSTVSLVSCLTNRLSLSPVSTNARRRLLSSVDTTSCCEGEKEQMTDGVDLVCEIFPWRGTACECRQHGEGTDQNRSGRAAASAAGWHQHPVFWRPMRRGMLWDGRTERKSKMIITRGAGDSSACDEFACVRCMCIQLLPSCRNKIMQTLILFGRWFLRCGGCCRGQ
jgi:hypothetical protein